MTDQQKRLRNLMRRVDRARNFPTNTCPASRHIHIMADVLARGKKYHMFDEEPQHCAETLLAVLEDLWKMRTRLEASERDRTRMRRQLDEADAEIRAHDADFMRMRNRIERLRGAMKTVAGWCFAVDDDDEWIARGNQCMEWAGDMEAPIPCNKAQESILAEAERG